MKHILIELGFLSDTTDREFVRDNINTVAEQIYNGIKEFLNER